MLARSLNDYICLGANEADAALRHAVDQLEAWQAMDPASIIDAFAVRFGELNIDDDVNFTFELPDHACKWPAPPFGRFPLHERLPKDRQPSSGRKQRRRKDHEQSQCRRRRYSKTRPRRRSREEADTVVFHTSMSMRSSPLRFLDLPAEIRNQVYSLLTVQDDPIQPALRYVFPLRRGHFSKQRHIRRSPPEPALATVSQQVRRESLSIFYGFNRFVLVKNSYHVFQNLSMTNPTIIEKWKPRDGLSAFLKHVDVNFSALSPLGGVSTWVSYGLRRLADENFTVALQTLETPVGRSSSSKRQPESKRSGSNVFCICSESETVPKLQAAIMTKETGGDLVQVAMFAIHKRLEGLFGASDGIKTSTYQPNAGNCPRCEKPTFDAVHVGL